MVQTQLGKLKGEIVSSKRKSLVLEQKLGKGFTYLAKEEGGKIHIVKFGPSIFAEYKTLTKLRKRGGHPNVMTEGEILEGVLRVSHNSAVATNEKIEYLHLPYLGDKNMLDFIQRRILKFPEFMQLFIPYLDGLNHIHKFGIVHGDVKPTNVMMGRLTKKQIKKNKLRPIFIDFEDTQEDTSVTTCTPDYIAPEVLDGIYTPKVDLYSTGIIMFRALTNYLPFHGGTYTDIFRAHRTKPVPKIPGVPERLERIVGKLLEKDPDKRFDSAAEVKEELLKLLVDYSLLKK